MGLTFLYSVHFSNDPCVGLSFLNFFVCSLFFLLVFPLSTLSLMHNFLGVKNGSIPRIHLSNALGLPLAQKGPLTCLGCDFSRLFVLITYVIFLL